MKARFLYIVILSLCLISCKKYLDKKPDKRLAIPTSLADFQALLDDNAFLDNATPGILDVGCDDYYVVNDNSITSVVTRNAYKWESDIFQGSPTQDWNGPYQNIYIANVVLDNLATFEVTTLDEERRKNEILGHAYFIRGLMHYFLEETFGQPYDSNTSGTSLGIPLKLTSSLEDKASRASVQAVYDQIISDLTQAAEYLPNTTVPISRPSKAAAFGMLARASLTMQDYVNAGKFADSSLRIKSTLFNYTSAATGNNPFFTVSRPGNDATFEMLYPCSHLPYSVFRTNTSIIDSTLYRSYVDDDLRKIVFFGITGPTTTPPRTIFFKGFYGGSNQRPFSGPATDEMYLIRAEASARAGLKDSAMADINTLLVTRWRPNTFTNYTATDSEDALRKVLLERRKELVFRGLRWIDLRRLNQDPRFAVTLKRIIGGQLRELPPNHIKYTYPIPDNEIRLSGIQQNPR
jgi:starch-binding outer membrane protein, SusD/RagB family